MPRGPKPTPTRLKIVRGNPGKRELNHDEPTPAPGANPPEWLSEKAAKHWNQAFAELDQNGVVTTMDADALALYCETMAEYVEARDNVNKTGALIKSPKGYPIQNPWVAIRNRAFERLTKLQVEFGMTPSSRSRVKTRKKAAVNPFADLVKKGRAA